MKGYKNEHTGTCMAPDRKVALIDTRDRTRVRARKEVGVDYTEMPVWTREESKDLLLE